MIWDLLRHSHEWGTFETEIKITETLSEKEIHVRRDAVEKRCTICGETRPVSHEWYGWTSDLE